MTVGELIEHLRRFPAENRVVVGGFNVVGGLDAWGYDDAQPPRIIKIGDYGEQARNARYGDASESPPGPIFDAVLIDFSTS